MKTLRKGDEGEDVKALQRALAAAGFPPGAVDGQFGPATDAAVRAFQASRTLLVDGIAGARTQRALGLGGPPPAAAFAMDAVTAARVVELFPGAPVGNIKTHLPAVKDELAAAALDDRPMVLMALATIRAETAGFEPISEGRSRYNTSPDGHPFDLYDHRTDLGNQGPPDGERYRGRGFIQLTGRFNYRRYGQQIGLGSQLERRPERANDSQVAARLLAAFLKSKEIRIKDALLADDLAAARRLVNGGRHGLAAFSDCFRRGEAMFPEA